MTLRLGSTGIGISEHCGRKAVYLGALPMPVL